MIRGSSPLFPDQEPAIPAFVREIPDAPFPPAKQFNFWAPERSGCPELDYSTGRRHFESALAFARGHASPGFIANVVGCMCNIGCGPMESGFIDALSCKAIYGRAPDPLSQDAVRQLGFSEGDFRADESEAKQIMEIARFYRRPDIIGEFMRGAVNRQLGDDILPFLWTVCAAAYLGAAN
jgi:hypothetical protein